MKVLNFGSLNVDYVFSVDHFVTEGETIRADRMEIFPGGKGLNQSVALSRAGAQVWHAGVVGTGSQILLDCLEKAGVQLEFLRFSESVPNGQAVLQVDSSGRNCIIVYPGSNATVTKDYIDWVLARFSPGDYLVLQNEISNIDYIICSAKAKSMAVFLNPSPITPDLNFELLRQVDCLILNEVEGKYLTGRSDFLEILDVLHDRCPETRTVLTIGKKGVLYRDQDGILQHPSYNVPVVDTTAAGDTFSGYFIACVSRGLCPSDALRYASMASGLCVGKKGASPSIPGLDQVLAFEQARRSAAVC